jgi:hypothetical protein
VRELGKRYALTFFLVVRVGFLLAHPIGKAILVAVVLLIVIAKAVLLPS